MAQPVLTHVLQGNPRARSLRLWFPMIFPSCSLTRPDQYWVCIISKTPPNHINMFFWLEKPSVVAEKVWILLSCPQFRWFCRWPELFDLRNFTNRYWKSSKFGASSLIIELDGGISKSAMPANAKSPRHRRLLAHLSWTPSREWVWSAHWWADGVFSDMTWPFSKGSFWDVFWGIGYLSWILTLWIHLDSWILMVFCMFWRFSAQGHGSPSL